MTKTQLVQRLDLMKMAQSGEMQEILSAVKDVAIYPDGMHYNLCLEGYNCLHRLK